MYQFPLILAGNELAGAYWLVKLTPLTVRLTRFQELMKDRLLICQQKVPAPSNWNGAVTIALTGLQAVLCVAVGTMGVLVRVAVGPMGVFVHVAVGITGVLVRVAVGGTDVFVAVGGLPPPGALPQTSDPFTYAGMLLQSV